jgi:hypothetical protein
MLPRGGAMTKSRVSARKRDSAGTSQEGKLDLIIFIFS